MHINISKIRSCYPEVFGIRKALQSLKVKRIDRYTLPSRLVELCESDDSEKEVVIAPYIKKWSKYLKPCYDELSVMVEKSPVFMGGGDYKKIETDIIFCRLAYGFIPSEYIGFALMNKTPEQRREFCSDLDMNRFGYTVNNLVEVQRVINKASSAEKYGYLFKRDYIIVKDKEDYDCFCGFIKKHPIFVKKKIFSSCGKGVELINLDNVSIDDYFFELIASGTWLLEELVKQNDRMGYFNDSSVNTVRCITFKTKKGIVVPYCFMRTGRDGAFVDNGGSGGLLLGIDVNKGIVDTDGFDEYGIRYEKHPDSNKQFIGFEIPEWNQLITICKEAAYKETKMNYLSWDMAYGESGWVVIEVNEVGQFIGPQIVYRKGIKKELEQYLLEMEHVI